MPQQGQRPQTRYIEPEPIKPIIPIPHKQPTRYQIETNRGRKPIEIASDATDKTV